MDAFLEANRRNWDGRVDIHARDATGFYDVAGFLAGADKLSPIEAAEIGDVRGLDVLHMQCHFGIDTLCLARRGAMVTGLDFSPSAIAQARAFAETAGLPARFVEGNVYDAPALTPGPFDMVFTTWGTVGWLPDPKGWARAIAAVLKPGGRFYFADTHPMLEMLGEEDGAIAFTYPWRSAAHDPIVVEEAATYTGDATPLASPLTYQWSHGTSDIVTALLEAGLELVSIREHEALVWPKFSFMTKGEDGLYRLPPGAPAMPLSLSLTARKPAG